MPKDGRSGGAMLNDGAKASALGEGEERMRQARRSGDRDDRQTD